jgi:hypothetical protein
MSRGKFHLNTIAERLELAMRESKLSVAEIIRRGGPSRPTLFRIQKDPSYMPERYTLDRLGVALNISSEWLRTGEGDMNDASRPASAGDRAYGTLEQLTPGIPVMVMGQALQAILEALPPRGIRLDDPRLAEIFQTICRRSVETNQAPCAQWVLEELIKPND